MCCGLAPAIQATRPSLVPALKQDEPRYVHRRWTLRGLLVVGQVAVALVLLLTALLFLRNLGRATQVDPGFDVDHTIVAQLSFVEGRYSRESRAAFLETAVAAAPQRGRRRERGLHPGRAVDDAQRDDHGRRASPRRARHDLSGTVQSQSRRPSGTSPRWASRWRRDGSSRRRIVRVRRWSRSSIMNSPDATCQASIPSVSICCCRARKGSRIPPRSDPVERAISHHLMYVREGWETRSLEQAVDDELREGATWAYAYLRNGWYHDDIRRYLDAFGDRVLVIVLEDFVHNIAEGMAPVWEFVGLAPVDIGEARAVNAHMAPRNRFVSAVMRRDLAWTVGRRLLPTGVRHRVRDATLAPAINRRSPADSAAVWWTTTPKTWRRLSSYSRARFAGRAWRASPQAGSRTAGVVGRVWGVCPLAPTLVKVT